MDARQYLKKYFGYESFREGQEKIINAILAGRDALAIMPTGAGKSICYQIPAVMLPGITLVISPLISLMMDQVKALNEAGIRAAFINSSLSETQIAKALQLAEKGVYKIIYVAPERLESHDFIHFAHRADISMITVDEAHCISQWGQDFRPSYLKIIGFVKSLPKRPIVSAFTATATQEVKVDILCVLNLIEPEVVVTGFDRKNLFYSVEKRKDKDRFVIEYVQKHAKESGIIYCATRKNVDNLFMLLSKQGVSVTRYHAGLDKEERKRNQDDFIYDRTPVIVATNAFGMGIDKSNVRYVIHYNMPQSMESYYQEAGRAGRDGETSQCILLFSAQDIMINKFLLENKDFSDLSSEEIEIIKQRDARRLKIMENYCRTNECLRNTILDYFGEKVIKPCDNCGNCMKDYKKIDMTEEAKQVINCVAETRGRYGLTIVLGTLIGANRARLKEVGTNHYKTYGALKKYSESQIRELIYELINQGYLIQSEDQYGVLKLGDISTLQDENAHVILKFTEEKTQEAGKLKSKQRNTDKLTSTGYVLFDALRKLRTDIAREEGLPPYIIFNDKTLIDMCVKLPLDEEAMLDIVGVGVNKLQKYGQRFLAVIVDFKKTHQEDKTSIQDDA